MVSEGVGGASKCGSRTASLNDIVVDVHRLSERGRASGRLYMTNTVVRFIALARPLALACRLPSSRSWSRSARGRFFKLKGQQDFGTGVAMGQVMVWYAWCLQQE